MWKGFSLASALKQTTVLPRNRHSQRQSSRLPTGTVCALSYCDHNDNKHQTTCRITAYEEMLCSFDSFIHETLDQLLTKQSPPKGSRVPNTNITVGVHCVQRMCWGTLQSVGRHNCTTWFH
eukprot:3766-Heterococcus_DN1.PRE.2